MEKKTARGIVTRFSGVVVAGFIMVVGFSSSAYADRKCEAALETMKTRFQEFMIENRTYAKLLSKAAKDMKKSAKKHKGDSLQIQLFVNDRELSQKEAKKINKMFQKAQLVDKRLGDITRGATALETKLKAAVEAYKDVTSSCDAE